jgi:hypothetical protein
MRKAAAMALATLVLAGCGGDDETPTLTGSDESGRSTATAPPAATVPPTATVPPATTVPPTRTTPPTTAPDAAAGTREPLLCPSEKDGGSDKAGVARLDARKLLGKSIAAAKATARRYGCSVRVVRRDGEDLIQTMDYSSARINVEERNGEVVALRGVA